MDKHYHQGQDQHQLFVELLQYMGNCVSENIVTYGKSSIDKIMLKKGSYLEHCSYQISTQSKTEYSDHKYIVMELEIERE